jgi:hypothetical protein
MKVKDLRIGDWVTNKMTGCKGQVEEIYSDSVKLKDDSVYDISFIQPLYLTEEILRDSGFGKDFGHMESMSQYECMYFMKDETFLGKDIRGFDLCAVYLTDDQRWESITIARVIFVHDLQHIFQVLGLDLELNLDSLA